MGFGAFLVTFCAGKKSPGARGRGGPEAPQLLGRRKPLRPHPNRKKRKNFNKE